MNRRIAVLALVSCVACYSGVPSAGTCTTDNDCVNLPDGGQLAGASCNNNLCEYACATLCGVGEACVNGACALQGRWVDGYYSTYLSSRYPPSAVDYSAITHLVVAGALPRDDGTLDTSFYGNAAVVPQLVSGAHAAGRKAIVMVGGSETQAGFEGAVTSTNLSGFVTNLVGLMNTYGFDGINIDWEPLSHDDEPSHLALAQALRQARPGAILIDSINWVTGTPDLSSYAQAANYFDHMAMMTFDMAGADTSAAWPGWLSWHTSALTGEQPSFPSSVSASANAYVAAGVPKSKLGIGMAFYGDCWNSVTGPRQTIPPGGKIIAGDNVMTYPKIMTGYYSPSAFVWDDLAKIGFLSFAQATGPVGSPQCTFISFETDASIAAKGQWLRLNGFGGVGIWTLNEGYDAATGTNPPLTSVKTAFLQ